MTQCKGHACSTSRDRVSPVEGSPGFEGSSLVGGGSEGGSGLEGLGPGLGVPDDDTCTTPNADL